MKSRCRGRLSCRSLPSSITTDGLLQTLAPPGYLIDIASEPGRIVPAFNTRWPTTQHIIDAVAVEFTAGYAPEGSPADHAANVPMRAKLAIKALTAHWYNEREPVPDTARVTEIPYHATRLIDGLRVWR
jgi:hypothetical protein